MKHEPVTGIQPEIFLWARKSVGLSVSDVADMLKLHIRRAHAYQLVLRDLFDGHNPTERHIWKGISLSTSESLTTQAQAILRRFLDQGRVGQAFYEGKAKSYAGFEERVLQGAEA